MKTPVQQVSSESLTMYNENGFQRIKCHKCAKIAGENLYGHAAVLLNNLKQTVLAQDQTVPYGGLIWVNTDHKINQLIHFLLIFQRCLKPRICKSSKQYINLESTSRCYCDAEYNHFGNILMSKPVVTDYMKVLLTFVYN